jgi:hypothetical protein
MLVVLAVVVWFIAKATFKWVDRALYECGMLSFHEVCYRYNGEAVYKLDNMGQTVFECTVSEPIPDDLWEYEE